MNNRQFNPTTLIFLAFMLLMVVRNLVSGSSGSIGDWVVEKLLILPGVLIGLVLHEFGHAFVADKLGDPTPKSQGRVTLNPIAHIDIIGLVALIFVGFGWGRPVEINPRYYKKPRRDEFLVSIAGVVMNLIVAIVFTIILKIIFMTAGPATSTHSVLYVVEMIIIEIIAINFILMIFNLMPIPPLDGFNIITQIFNLKKYSWWETVYRNGFWLFLIFIMFDFSGKIISPILSGLMDLVYMILY